MLFVPRPEIGDDFSDLLGRIGDREQKILIFSLVYKLLHQYENWHFLCPELLSEEDHRTRVTEAEVVVLYCVLEDFLHRSGAAR